MPEVLPSPYRRPAIGPDSDFSPLVYDRVPVNGAPKPIPGEGRDYDMEGYRYKYGNRHWTQQGHYTDEFKLPNHDTFSNQSRYSTPQHPGGVWQEGGVDRYTYVPTAFNMQMHPPAEMAKYFQTRERKNTFVQLPDGRLVEGSQP